MSALRAFSQSEFWQQPHTDCTVANSQQQQQKLNLVGKGNFSSREKKNVPHIIQTNFPKKLPPLQDWEI